MKKKQNTKNNKSMLLAGIATVAIVTLVISVIASDYVYSSSNHVTNLISSGPFGIDKSVYMVNEPLFFVGSNIPYDQQGKIIFKRADGEIVHQMGFDGSKDPNYKYYFTPAPADLWSTGCRECIIGTWEISFDVADGNSYPPIFFDVKDGYALSVEGNNE